MKDEVIYMSNKDKSNFIRKLFKEFSLDDEYEDEFDDVDFDFNNSWFHKQFQETAYKNGVKKSVQEKLFTSKKLTFEEYTTLLEIVTEKFRDSFNCNNGKFDIIFRERTLEEKVNKVLEKQTDKEIESEDKDYDEQEK